MPRRVIEEYEGGCRGLRERRTKGMRGPGTVAFGVAQLLWRSKISMNSALEQFAINENGVWGNRHDGGCIYRWTIHLP